MPTTEPHMEKVLRSTTLMFVILLSGTEYSPYITMQLKSQHKDCSEMTEEPLCPQCTA